MPDPARDGVVPLVRVHQELATGQGEGCGPQAGETLDVALFRALCVEEGRAVGQATLGGKAWVTPALDDLTELVSAITGIAVRADVAMTGEITLRGEVLPIGGLKEKLLAALRGGIQTVLIPLENERELSEIPANIKGNLDIKPVKWIDEVLQVALVRTLPLVDGDAPQGAPPEEPAAEAEQGESRDEGGLRPH